MARSKNRRNRSTAQAQRDKMLADQVIKAQAAQDAAQARAVARFESHSVQLVSNVFAQLFAREYTAMASAIVKKMKAEGRVEKLRREDVLANIDCQGLAELSRLAAREAMIGLEILTLEDPGDDSPSVTDRPLDPVEDRTVSDHPTSEASPDEQPSAETSGGGIVLPDGSFDG